MKKELSKLKGRAPYDYSAIQEILSIAEIKDTFHDIIGFERAYGNACVIIFLV